MTKVFSAERRIALILGVVLATELQAQRALLTGVVRDGNQQPVPHANVIVTKQGRYVADDSGRFSINVPTGAVLIDIRRIGYRPTSASLEIARDTSVDFLMLPVAQALPAQDVRAAAVDNLARQGFYDRMRDADRGLTTGYFVTPEDIEARHALKSSQFLEGVPGVKLLGTGGGNQIPVGLNDCAMTIYLDGARLLLDNQSAGGGSSGMSIQRTREGGRGGKVTPGESFDGIIGSSSVAGIEIYPRGTRAPARYQTLNGTCGIIVVWTR